MDEKCQIKSIDDNNYKNRGTHSNPVVTRYLSSWPT